MTGLELMANCGYDISHLTEEDAKAFWMELMRTGITGPREPMEIFAESLREKRISSSTAHGQVDDRAAICEWCCQNSGSINSRYWIDDSGGGHWVCQRCEDEMSDRPADM